MIDAPRRELDAEIDRVAAKLVAVTDDERLMQQVMMRLPERTAAPWLAAMPVQLAAAAALLLLAFLYARPAREARPVAAPHVAAIGDQGSGIGDQGSEPGARRSGRRPSALRAVATVQRRATHEQERSLIPDPRSPIPADHERSLAPVAPLPALELTSILPAALEPDAAAELAPLVLTDLALAGDFISPREP